jgi:hypothetical protein
LPGSLEQPALSQSHSIFELHERVLADLEQRKAAVLEQEAEARRVLEQTLAHCAAKCTSIEQDRAVLVQAENLYRRFIDTDGDVPEGDAAQPEPAPQREPLVMEEQRPEPSVMELRRQLWNEHQIDGISQREAWAAQEPLPNAPTGSY